MSGGFFDYKDTELKSIIFGYADSPTNQFNDREITELVWDILDLMHDYDRYISGDTGYDTWVNARNKFKEKWLGANKDRVKRTIDRAIDEVRDELYNTYGVVNDE